MLERALEVQQAAERPLPDRRDVHRNPLGADQGRGDVPVRLAVATRRALEQFAGGGDGLAEFGVRPGIGGILEEQLAGIGEGAGRIERRLAHFVEPIGRRPVHRAKTEKPTSRRKPSGAAAAPPNSPIAMAPAPSAILQCSSLSFFGHRVNPTGEYLPSPEERWGFSPRIIRGSLFAGLQQGTDPAGAPEQPQEHRHRNCEIDEVKRETPRSSGRRGRSGPAPAPACPRTHRSAAAPRRSIAAIPAAPTPGSRRRSAASG